MLANIVSQTSPGAGSLYIRASSSNVLAPLSTSLLLQGRHHQQTRSYRCGIWSSYFGPGFLRHSRRRQRMIKYQYAESQNRKSSWDQNPLTDDAKTALRRVIGKYWQAGASLCGSRMVSYDRRQYAPNEEGKQKDDDTQKTTSTSSTWTSPLGDVIHRWTKQTSQGIKRAGTRHESSTAEGSSAGASPEEDFIIDPITNRKVIRKTYRAAESNTESGIESPAGTSKPYKSQFGTTNPYKPVYWKFRGPEDISPPIDSIRTPSREESRRYEEVEIAPLSAAPYQSRDSTATYHPQPGVQSEEYSLNHLPPEDQAEVYDDLHKYTPSEHDEFKDIAAEAAPKYDDLHSYKPTEHDEIHTPSVGATQAYDDLHEYKPAEHDEIKYEPEQAVPKYNDLHNYRPTEHDEIASSTSQSAPKYDDLGDYTPFRYKQSDATQPKTNPVYDDLHKYRPYMHNEDAVPNEASAPKYDDLDNYKSPTDQVDNGVDPAKPQYEDLDKYQPFLHQEEQSEAKQGEQYEDLDKYRSDVFKETERAEEGEPFEQYGDLDQYKAAYRYQEPDGKAPVAQDTVEKSLGEFDANKENRENLEQAMTGYIAVSDAIDREVSAGLQRSRRRAMEDQPSVKIFRYPSEEAMELLQKIGRIPAHEARQVDVNYSDNMTHGFNSNVEPALGRMKAAAATGEPAESRSKSPVSRQEQPEADADPGSEVSEGMKASSDEDGRDTAQAHNTKKYGDLNPENPVTIPPRSPSPTSPPPDVAEPTIYKILAYDPTMQNVSIAETTSIVPDQAAPLTPSEVLVRLSNPTKFFPHFEPLRAEGFEIVSGSGDVLVFRKVHKPSTSTLSESESNTDVAGAAAPLVFRKGYPTSTATPPSSPETAAAPPVNPIDMMGRDPLPSAAAFASPTGFVNYNDSFVEEQPPRAPPPPFRSNIDVRREEPVFSGPKVYADRGMKKKKKTPSLIKRIFVGGVSVAGVSYALGVIGEYFSTGGIDGKGPTGF
ncbi:hypothetical protein PG994_000682 [Apiospora phragmitis]|uniref:Uncharacterized protein n=1 Tax=Apiospora phragmitis TaxID=2905665 RepID=A0ABR1X744_9PEZI